MDLNDELGTAWQDWEVPELPPNRAGSPPRAKLEAWAANCKTTLKQWSTKARQMLEALVERKKRGAE